MLATLPLLEKIVFPPLYREGFSTLQVNLGYRCNLQCQHCHVNAGPQRKERMSAKNIASIIELAEQRVFSTLDLTGGAPELHPQFRQLVAETRSMGIHVIDRCNLTILEEPEQDGLAEFLAQQGVEVVASLPCYLEQNVDAQRGKGTFGASIRALKQLNKLGYGSDAEKRLNLVYNPQGATLPPPQQLLQDDYKQRLKIEHNIEFNQLLTIANMPIQRFGSALISKGEFEPYMQLLQESHQAGNLNGVMCRTLISVDWQGQLYDCDFNQMLGLPLRGQDGSPMVLAGLLKTQTSGLPIEVRGHCYGCTAGQGSSCGGAL